MIFLLKSELQEIFYISLIMSLSLHTQHVSLENSRGIVFQFHKEGADLNAYALLVSHTHMRKQGSHKESKIVFVSKECELPLPSPTIIILLALVYLLKQSVSSSFPALYIACVYKQKVPKITLLMKKTAVMKPQSAKHETVGHPYSGSSLQHTNFISVCDINMIGVISVM